VTAGPYDALLLVSFGGPEGPDDVLPFLRNVTRGRDIPDARLAQVAEHYQRFGGVSPINEQNRKLRTAISEELAAHDVDLPVFWGNRNWGPYLADALAEMRDAGVGRVLAFVTSAYSSYSGCRQYRENLAAARAEVGARAPEVDKVRHYFDHPGFVDPFIDSTVAAVQALPLEAQAAAPLVFTTHSVPLAQAETSGPRGGAYIAQHRAAARLVADAVRARTDSDNRAWDLVFQSRSGPPTQSWLEPDVGDHLERLAQSGAPGAVIVPIGFVSDHLEVVWDLDTEAAQRADALGLPVRRAATPATGPDPRFVAMVRELVLERVAGATRRALSPLGPSWDVCAGGCCPNPRGGLPTVAGAVAS
jgi:protoporphyrin/coproporphyrin ferrochelatase